MTRRLCLALLLCLPAWAGRFDLPEGKWGNQQRPGFQVVVGDAKSRGMSWDLDGLVLKGSYRVTSAVGAPHVLFHVDSLTADGQVAKSGSIGNIPVRPGDDVRSLWDWTEKGVKLTVQGEGEEQLTVELFKIVPRR